MKKVIALILLLMLIGCIIIYNIHLSNMITVLTYHDFTKEETTNNMQLSEKEFEKQIRYLYKHNYKSLKLNEVECFIEGKCKIKGKKVLITMDDGWINELNIALPILKKYNMNAVIFYVGEHYDDNNENFIHRKDLEKIKKEYPNIEIASHSYLLHYEDAYLSLKEEVLEDINKMKDVIDTKYYAYPYGKYTKEYIDAIKTNYSLAFTFGPDERHRKKKKKDSKYELPRLNTSTKIPFSKFIIRLLWYK